MICYASAFSNWERSISSIPDENGRVYQEEIRMATTLLFTKHIPKKLRSRGRYNEFQKELGAIEEEDSCYLLLENF